MPNITVYGLPSLEASNPRNKLLWFGLGESGISAAPVVSALFPAANVPVNPASSLGFDVTVPGGKVLALITISLGFSGVQVEEVVYDGNAFVGAYTGTITAIAEGFRFRFQRAGGLLGSPRMKIRAVSSGGAINL